MQDLRQAKLLQKLSLFILNPTFLFVLLPNDLLQLHLEFVLQDPNSSRHYEPELLLKGRLRPLQIAKNRLELD